MPYAVSTLLLFLTAVSLDSLTAGFSYGTKKVHVSILSLLLLACVLTRRNSSFSRFQANFFI